MKIWYDTEFLDNGEIIDLISIGLVREDGATYYAVNADVDITDVVQHDWLRENVVPHLPMNRFGTALDRTHPDVRRSAKIAYDVMEFIRGGGYDVELWSWYSAYDHVALCQLWGSMAELPDGIPMYTNDIRTLFHIFGNPTNVLSSTNNHNALDDAQYHRKLYEFITQYAQQKFKFLME